MRALRLVLGCIAVSATVLNAQTRTGTTTTTTRTITTAPAPAPPPLIIPGGAGDILNTPLWFTATKLVCDVQTNDGSPSDEAYVVIATVQVNWEKLWESKAVVRSSKIYEGMNNLDFRSLGISVWEGDNGPAIPVRSPNDVIVSIAVYEHDNGNPAFATVLAQAALIAKIGTWHPGYTYAQLAHMIDSEFSQSLLHSVQRGGGDDPLTAAISKPVPITAQDLTTARSGGVVKKAVSVFDELGGGTVGKYTVQFQLAKQGVSQVAW